MLEYTRPSQIKEMENEGNRKALNSEIDGAEPQCFERDEIKMRVSFLQVKVDEDDEGT